MKFYLLVLIAIVVLGIPSKQLLAQSDQIAAVYYDKKTPDNHLKKEVKKEDKTFRQTQCKEYQREKTPIVKKTEGMKGTGIALLIVGAIVFAVAIILFIVGLWSSLAMIALAILLGLFGLAGLIVGGVLFGVGKRKESGN